MTRQPAAGARSLGPLAALRLRLTAWYVGTYAVILLVLGGGLFLVVARQVRKELDQSLESAAAALIQDATADVPQWRADLGRLRIPGMSLYLFDTGGHPLLGDTASEVVRDAAKAAVTGPAIRQVPSGAERVSRAFARTFRASDGHTLIAVAAADLEDLEDRYTRLIWQFGGAAAIALGLVALGGVFLARKSSAPVEAVVEHMRQFMADASHELRTPVTVLRTEADVALARSTHDTDDRRAFEVISAEAARLTTVVEDLLILARAEDPELSVERTPLFLDDLVSDVVSAFGNVAALGGVSISLVRFEEAQVLGNAVLLWRLVSALIDNAIKYTPPGGTVAVEVRAGVEGIAIEVADTGIGISTESLPRVFDRFYRSDRARAARPGTGLGLPIAAWIAEAHGGSISITSNPEQGTTVTVALPR